MGLARSWALTAVSACVAPWLGHHANPLRQRVREFWDEARAKRGTTRHAVVVASCFAPRWAWVLRLGDGTHVALALAAPPGGTGCTVLVISVVYRGCALPLAGTVLTATVEQAWRPAWLRRLRQGYRAVPPPWTVIVLAERRWDARWLGRRIPRLGGQPVLRIKTGGTCRPPGERPGGALKTVVPQPGCPWSGTGVAFKGRQRRLCGTLRAPWAAG